MDQPGLGAVDCAVPWVARAAELDWRPSAFLASSPNDFVSFFPGRGKQRQGCSFFEVYGGTRFDSTQLMFSALN